MSLIALAEYIDQLIESDHALASEARDTVVVSSLSIQHVSELRQQCDALHWQSNLFDSADAPCDPGEPLDAGFEPYKIVIQKPAAAIDVYQLLTSKGFAQALTTGLDALDWRVARLTFPLVTGIRIIQSWEGALEVIATPETKSPRAFVKEFGDVRRVPEDIRQWLTPEFGDNEFADHAAKIWVRAATSSLANSLPDELDAITGQLKFRGPPRLALPAFDSSSENLDVATFNTLLKVCGWVFEQARDAEMRHILVGAELARSAPSTGSITAFLRSHLAHALESAQIAYQMALAETGRDTLKVLGELRKAVTDETAKLSDIGRQLAAAVAAAITTGIGLIAARVAANASGALVSAVMVVVAVYIAMVISSGIQFMRLQRELRSSWQNRLYRFLPANEYASMVTTPTQRAERSLILTAWLGGVAVAILTIACGWVIIDSSRVDTEITMKGDQVVPQGIPLPTPDAAPPAPVTTTAKSAHESGDIAPAAADRVERHEDPPAAPALPSAPTSKE